MKRKTRYILQLCGLSAAFLIVLGIGVMWMQVDGTFWSEEPVLTRRCEGVSAVACDMASYAIEVRTWNGADVSVAFYRWGLGTASEPEISVEDGTLWIREPARAGFLLGGGKVVVQVPAGQVLPYDLHTVSGSVKLEAPSETAVLQTVSGSIKVYTGGGPLNASTTSGSIKVYQPFETLELRTVSGSVKAAADAGTRSVQMQTTSGSIKLRMTDVSGYRMEYSSVSGSAKDEYHDLRYDKEGTAEWGDQSLSICAVTVSGSIKLTDWED